MTQERKPRPPLMLVARQADVGFYQRRAAQHGSPVLVLGCANGRIPWELAASGSEVVGVDPSERMIASAEERRSEESLEVATRTKFLRADLRSLRLDRKFPLVLAPQNAVALMTSLGDLEALFATVKSHLAENGSFVFDLVNAVTRTPARLVEDSGHPDFVEPGRPMFSPHLEERSSGQKGALHRLKLRHFSTEDVTRALAVNGLAEHERFGGFDGKAFDPSDPVRIGVAS
jgi:SAM-dependent methyltransferase